MLIGRESECARIAELLDRAQAGRSGALVLRGEAGIGKTALLDYATELAGGMTVVRALGVESEAELEFSGLLEVCRPLLDFFGELPERQAEALRGALGLSRAEAHDRFTIGAATLGLLAAAAEASPLLVLVDDAHWLDRSSQDALFFATKRLEADRILIVYAAREGEERTFEPRGIEAISLAGLPRDAAASLLRTHAPMPVVAAVADRLYEATGGNPLALIELPRLLSVDQLGGSKPLEEPLPAGSSVERAFARHAAALPESARRALVVAAVSSSSIVETIVSALAVLGLDTSALEPAEDAGLVRLADGRVEFRHSLARSAVYHSAAPSERRGAHRALAEALVGEAAAEERAWHLAAAALGPDEDVAAALESAAHESLRRAGFSAAAAALERAARLTPEEEPRLRRLYRAAHASWQAGHGDRAIALANEALERCDERGLRADLLHLLGHIDYFGGTPTPAADLLLEAARLVEPRDPSKAVVILSDAFEACWYAGNGAGALEAGLRARDLAPNDDGVEDFLAEMTLAEALFFNGRARDGAPMFERGIAIFDESRELKQDPLLVTRAAIGLGWLERGLEARDLALQAVRLAREQGAVAALPYALIIVSWGSRQLGHWQEAFAAASEGVALARELGQATLLSECLVEQAVTEACRGQEDECRAHAEEAATLAERLKLGYTRERAAYALGLLELGLGHLEAASERLRSSAERLDGIGLDVIEPSAAPDLVEAAIGLGRIDDARAAMSLVRPGSSPAVSRGIAWRCRGLVAGDDEFERYFERSLEVHPDGSHVFQKARTRLCFGERLRRVGRRAEAREQLRAALATFEGLAAEPWAARARAGLRASGEKLRRQEAHETEELTPQELQIALQVAEGRSNKEVGAALFLSHKTVEFHLSRIYRKLDVHSRSELTRRFAERAVPAQSPVGP